jgi:hypothetical protein
MAIEVRSPHTGQPVRIRDEDIGRTVRDPSGNIFYVLRSADGEGYYASVTRTGGDQAEQTYRQRLETGNWPRKPAVEQPADAAVYDATGRRRAPGTLAKAVFLAVVLAILVVIYLFAAGHLRFGATTPAPMPTPTPNQTPNAQPPPGPAADAERSREPQSRRTADRNERSPHSDLRLCGSAALWF